MEEEYVPATGDLARVAAQQGAHHGGGMGDVEDGQARDALRVQGGERPGDDCAPIVPGDAGGSAAAGIHQSEDVVSECLHVERGRFGGEVVAALVGNDDAEAGLGQRTDLVAPGVPEFGEAVQQD